MDKVHEYANPRMRAVVRDWPVELLQMELAVPNIWKLELMALTVTCFLSRFVRCVEGVNEGPLEYLLFPSQKPWDSTLRRFTQYQPSDLSQCIKALLALATQRANSTLPASRDKLYLLTESGEKNLNLDYDSMDPHSCEISPFDDYLSLRAIEVQFSFLSKKRIRVDYMDKVQDYAKPYMHECIVDWLVLVGGSLKLSKDTLYLAIYYMDLYLSGTVLGRNKFQLLGATCLMIASKYEDTWPAKVEVLCDKTKGRYSVDELLQMEVSVMNILEFELWAPTVGCFLERLVIVAQHINEEASFVSLASYISELSLMDYGMLCYAPSVVAASAIFLARFMLSPSQKPWNSTFTRFSLYQPSDLYECVKALHTLVTQPPNPNLSAIRNIYSKPEHFRVAKKYSCPPLIPMEHFENSCCSAG
ncbi:cyclin-A1-4-like [Rutidosis leptorrhynchoides]|uniref:cyclin-A1-4-like n=1 Tax=Rutidosis leptorrhynchoides TaxID=125765 RepID=UPI003A9A502B